MNTVIISLLSGLAGMFGWGLYDFLGGVYAKRVGAFRSFFWSQLAGLATVFLLVFAFTITFEVSLLSIALLSIAAIVYSAGYLLFFKGFEVGNVSIVAATMNLWAVFTMLFAFIFMGQRLSAMQSLGVFLIISGVTLASLNWREIKNHGFRLSLGVKETVLGAFFFGVFWNISEAVSEEIGWLPATLFVKIGIIGFLLLFSVFKKRELAIAKAAPGTKIAVSLMGAIEAGAVAIVNYGLTVGDAILITPIASALSVVTISLAFLFLKDKVTPLQGLGMAAAVVGISVTAL